MNETKRLYRSESDVMLGGVCAGLGDYFTLDPTIIRLIFTVLFFTGSAGFWIYLIMWIVVPRESEVKGTASASGVVIEGKRVDPSPAEDPTPIDLDEIEME